MERSRSIKIPETQEKKELPKRILEIGAGGKSFYELFKLPKPNRQDKEVSLDYFDEYIEKAKVRNKNKNRTFVIADGQNLPFPDKTFDEVYLTNVLNSYAISHMDEARSIREDDDGVGTPTFDYSFIKPTPKQLEDFKNFNLNKSDTLMYALFDNICNEALRVLKDTGKLKIIEGPANWYPNFNDNLYQIFLKRLQSDTRYELVKPERIKKPPR